MGGSSASAGGAGRPGVTGHRQLQAALRKAHESLRRARPRVTSGARAPLEERIDEGSGGVPRRCSEEILFSRGTGADPQRGRRGRARSCHPHKLEKKPRRDMRGGDGLTPPPPSLRAARRGWRAGTSGGARAPPTSTGPAQIRPPPRARARGAPAAGAQPSPPAIESRTAAGRHRMHCDHVPQLDALGCEQCSSRHSSVAFILFRENKCLLSPAGCPTGHCRTGSGALQRARPPSVPSSLARAAAAAAVLRDGLAETTLRHCQTSLALVLSARERSLGLASGS